MKKILLTITGFVVTLLALAQSPNLMNYQGVARNAAGNVLPSQPVGLRLSILSGSPTGTVVYQETRNVTTNAFGLFNVQVGSPGAITTTGTIAAVNWTAFGVGSGTKYLQVEIDPIGGTSYFNVGSTQLVSVPYSLNAGAAAPVGPAGGDLLGSTYPNPIIAPLVVTTGKIADGAVTTQKITFPIVKTQSDPATLISMTNSSATNGSSGISGTTNGNGPSSFGVVGTANNGGFGVAGYSTAISVLGVTTATGQAGRFENFSATNGTPTVGVWNGAGTGSALDVNNNGTGRAGFFQVNNAANTANVIEAITNGTGTAGTFTVNNTSSTTDALRAVTNGTGASWAIRATSTGSNGAGLFISNNPAVTNNNLQSNTNGLGRAGLFNSTNAASTGNAVDINVAGTGFALRAASSNAAPKALLTAGGVQLTGIGEANNLILKSDAVGNANWATPASVGIVTGSGTLNFVPKWTPNGTNLGNSKIFDDGTFVGIGTTTPGAGLVVAGNGIWNSAIGILNTGSGMEWRTSVNGTTYTVTKVTGSTFSPVQLFSTGGMDFSNSAGTSIARLADNGNVGIETTAPQHRLSVGPTTADAQGVMVRGFGNGPINWKGGAAFGNTNATVIMGELGSVAQIGGHNSNLTAWAPLAINSVPGFNVGIGTAAPAYALDVNHNGGSAGLGLHVRSLASYSVIDLDAANGDAALRYQSAGSTRWNVRNAPGSNDYQILRNNNLPANVTIANTTGYMGIVQTAPAYQLDVLHGGGGGGQGIRSKSSADYSVVDIDAANGDEALRFLNNGAGDWHIGGGAFGGLNFYDFKTAQNRMLIQNVTGNVGIGTNAPITRLHVEANAPGSALQTYRNLNNTGFTSSWYLNPAGSLMGHFGYGNPGAFLWADQMFAGSVAAVPFVFTTSDQERMRITPVGNVGIGTNAPTSKFEVVNAGTNISGLINQTNTANANHALRVLDANVSNVSFGNSAFFARRGAAVGAEWLWTAEPVSVTGISSTGPGMQGSSSTNVGIVGMTNSGVGVYAFSGTPAGYALQTYGRVQITGQGAALGNVLTSDAAGNATWQENTSQSVGISIRGLGAGITVPNNTTVPITQWSFIDNEDGGANYNGTTGEYTVTKAGVYQVNCTVMWNGFSSPASFVNLLTRVNGSYYTEQFGPSASSNTFSHLNFAKKYNVGDKINFELFQNSGNTQTTLGNFGSNTLSIQFLHK